MSGWLVGWLIDRLFELSHAVSFHFQEGEVPTPLKRAIKMKAKRGLVNLSVPFTCALV